MGRRDHTIDNYLSIYSLHVDIQQLWEMFLYLSKGDDLNEILKKHLISNLKKHIILVSMPIFLKLIRSAQELEKWVKNNIHTRFKEILEAIVDAFIENRCRETQSSRQLSRSDWKQLFDIRRQLSTVNNIQQSGSLAMYQHLLFTMDTQIQSTVERIKRIFQNLNDLDESLYKNNDPACIIQDEWLQDYIVNIPQGTWAMYRQLLHGSILSCFISAVDIKKMISSINSQQYKFLITTPKIDSIIAVPKPKDINITDIESKEQFFDHFIRQVNEWLLWFDNFIEIFRHIVEWFKTYKVEGAEQLFIDLLTIRNDSTTTFIQTRIIIEKIVRLLRPFNDLRRLCHFFNCLHLFQIIESGTLSNENEFIKYMKEIKSLQPNNSFVIESKSQHVKEILINSRQHVHWSIAGEKHSCNIKVEYRFSESNEHSELLFSKNTVSIHKYVLHGEFETQKSGCLLITIDNVNPINPLTMWFRVTSVSLSTSHLFYGIFNMLYQKYYNQPVKIIKEDQWSKLLDHVFSFIDKLLTGSISLREMTDLKTVFSGKNISVRDEVKKLFTNRSTINTKQRTIENTPTDREIEQVCEWLQIYQYYSHVSIIIDCIDQFDIIPADTNDESIGDLKRLSSKEDCSLKEITQAYVILHQRFQNLSSQHLQLIKVAIECSAVVQMMRKADLYSTKGRHRFQELRDNLTTQFQLQERNNMILNSWIITYSLCEPFVLKAHNLEEFIVRIASLSNVEESSSKHMKVVNDNLQLVSIWLSTEETTSLDNALITMEHLYKTGLVKIHLRRLTNEQSYFEIEYSIDKIQTQNEESGKIQFTLSKTDIDDHKRQLTFCNVDLQQDMFAKKILLNEQLKLLHVIDKIYSIFIKFEMAGHPDYQLRNEIYSIHDQKDTISQILIDLKKNPHTDEQRLEQAVKVRTDELQSIYSNLEVEYNRWIEDLDRYRQENSLLKLFSNPQVLILIVLLTTTTEQNRIKYYFLEKIVLSESMINKNETELKLTIQYMIHYLRSLRINNCNLSEDNVLHIYNKHKIDYGTSSDRCLKQVSEFLRELFQNWENLLTKHEIVNEGQQFLVTLNSTEQTIFKDYLDMETYYILINIFNNQLPASYQILWCSMSTEDDIRLFFSRVRTFRHLIFVAMDIDNLNHRLREFLLQEQDILAQEPHAHIYYFSRELTSCRKGLRPFYATSKIKPPNFQQKNYPKPDIQIVYGTSGIGKTHRINTKYKDNDTKCFSINDTLNLSLLIRSFLSYESIVSNDRPSVYFNISLHAPFNELNRVLFSLFICNSLTDVSSGLTFSLPILKSWKFFIEIPYTEQCEVTTQENFDRILPILSILSSSILDEVTDDNYQLSIGDEEEFVARFLKAYENKTIDQCLTRDNLNIEIPVSFEKLTDQNDCRQHIYTCIEKYAPELPRNKIYELSFTKFLFRRVQFFTGHYYCYNEIWPKLGSIVMKQMIDEAKSLTQINFGSNAYSRVYLVYDPNFSLHLLHNDWNQVPKSLKHLVNNKDPSIRDEHENQSYYGECLAWLIDIQYHVFEKIMNETKFILTENFAYKIFHVHERKLTRLPMIIEGETGVGKTFLLKFYSLLLNAKLINGPLNENIAPRIRERTSLWLIENVIVDILEKEPTLLNKILHRVIQKLWDFDNNEEVEQKNPHIVLNKDQQIDNDDDDPMLISRIQDQIPVPNPIVENIEQHLDDPEQIDHDLLKEIKHSLQNYEYQCDMLQYIWKIIMQISSEDAMNIADKLIVALNKYITSQLINLPLNDASFQLKNFLRDSSTPSILTSIQMFEEFVAHTRIKPLFYRLLLHPGVTEEQIDEFMLPICQLARELSNIELVVFFDEVNTSSCLGLFKEMFMDRTLHGSNLPTNIFFTAAINPSIKINHDDISVHRRDYVVHQLPHALENLKVVYGILGSNTLSDYIRKKIEMFTVNSTQNDDRQMPLELYAQGILTQSILRAQEFCEEHLGKVVDSVFD
ncbi:unnamed protein product [Rotaria sp. Silwood2]|nr:unnamed protein product [Rotaria sp. Silwood2]